MSTENIDISTTSTDGEEELFVFMMKGMHIIKLSHTGKKHEAKQLYLDEDKEGFRYKPSKKKYLRYEIGKITDLVPGECEQKKFQKFSKDHTIDRCLSVKFGDSNSLEIIFDSMNDLRRWSTGIEKLRLDRGKTQIRVNKVRDHWLTTAFESFDKNKDGSLGLGEVTKLLKHLNVKMSPKVVRKKFEDVNKNGPGKGTTKGGLTKDEFAAFFKDISRRDDLDPLLEKYAPDGFFTVDSFKEFLQNEQNMTDATSAYCEEIIERFEATTEGKESKQLGIDGFARYLLSEEGDIFKQDHLKIYQDMTQPLSHYFIASSHNTYLMEDQIRGPSSLEAYKNAFNKGCRCVELDCWDGENGEPVVYHGYTLTSKIFFKDIINVVKEYAFKVSEYPVILSLENHCSIPQQRVMASHLENILGDMLYKEPINAGFTTLPSPEFFKKKILIKGKKLKPKQEADGEEDEAGDVTDEDEAADIEQNAAEQSMNAGGDGDVAAEPKQNSSSGVGMEDAVDGVSKRSKDKAAKVKKEKQHKKVKLAKELSLLVNYISSVGFKSFEQSEFSGKVHQMSSFVEGKVMNLVETYGPDFVKYNCRQLSRTYPAGGRIDSSNYNPQHAWNVGCQIVALNYQTDGEMLHLNMGRFKENGRAGYNLKPEVLRNPSFKVDPQTTKGITGISKTRLKIQVISGQQLPKPVGDSTKGEIIDPYVMIDIHGIAVDSSSYKTKVVKDNGFNPYWGNEKPLEKDLLFADVAMIRFSVFDADVGFDDFIGECSVPFTSLQTGYRHVHLSDWRGKPLEHASLFVHVEIENTGKRKTKAS